MTIDGRDYNVELTNGKGQLAVPGFKAGEHDVVAKYPGSQNYTNSSNSTTFKVTRNTPEVSIDSQDINVGDMETITVTVPKDATGNVTITVAGKTYTAPVKDGKAVFNVPGLKVGIHHIKAYYEGDEKYESSQADGYIEVVDDNHNGSHNKAHEDGIDLASTS